ncbi:hypothetical protein [Larkinella soli]|uniref:hypothetical protein n=1 Tax=Larkinella soli TaxID=1770527 RepID=UPI000FFC1A7E|nr:hypothetical protein [Larkinella soli]
MEISDVNTKPVQSLASGLAGALALTLVHETARRFIPEAPRADLLGMRAIAKIMESAGQKPPADDELHTLALAGDVVSNAAYYSLVGLARDQDTRLVGSALGALAGLGAVLLPGPMGLGKAPSARTPATVAMTIGWYFIGGLAAGSLLHWWRKQA